MDDAERFVRDLFIEAASKCGDDVRAITQFVERRLSAMSDDERRSALDVGRRVVAYRAPVERPSRSH